MGDVDPLPGQAEVFVERLLAGDDNKRRLLHRTLERHERQVRASAPGSGFVPRPEAREIVDNLTADGSPRVLLLDAPAGFGKSAVAMQVAAELEERGWHVAVARLNNASTLPTSKHLGEQMGLGESPLDIARRRHRWFTRTPRCGST